MALLTYRAELALRTNKRTHTRRLGDCVFESLEDFVHNARPHRNNSFNLSGPEHRIVAIGDIHADFEKLLFALQLAGAIDGKCRWMPTCSSPLTVVITGDVLDQGGRLDDDDKPIEPYEENGTVELEIVQFLFSLDACARSGSSGRVHVTLGNHELENFRGNFQSSTPQTNAGWGGVFGRTEAFKRGGPLASLIADAWPLVLCLGPAVFTHAGLVVPTGVRGITFDAYVDLVNAHVRAFLSDARIELPKWVDDASTTRAVSENFSGTFAQCAKFAREVLSPLDFGNRILVVGHTPQLVAWSRSGKNGINGVCKNRIWRIDVGMSKAFGNSGEAVGVEVLEINLGPPYTFSVLRDNNHRLKKQKKQHKNQREKRCRRVKATGTTFD